MLNVVRTVLVGVIAVLSSGTTNNDVISQSKVIKPDRDGNCPVDYPIKGNFTTHSGERCIYHLPGQRFYHKTKAERCYATTTLMRFKTAAAANPKFEISICLPAE